MTQIILISNPFQPLKDMERFQTFDGITPRDWLTEHFGPDFVEFDVPTVLQWNGQLVMRADWETRQFEDGDIACFIHVPQGIELIIIAIVAIVVAVGAYLLMPDPKIPSDNTQSADSVYTLRGQTNRFRPNEPIEVQYGKCRSWPTYGSRPYSAYIGNEQYQYSLFCLGQGEFDILKTQLDDTPTGNFTEIELEICPPGVPVTLVESSVFTALEVSNIELLGPNEPSYSGPSGPYTVNDSGTVVHRLAVDVSFPQGLYNLTDKGKLSSYAVELLFEYREINDAGGSIGTWQILKSVTVTRSDNTPQRITYSKNVTRGRYEVRARRITDKSSSTKISSQVRWESVKAYAKDVGTFGNVTMIAMKALATNSLNDSSSKSFNVISTRKLQTWTSGGGWSAGLTATRNPIWAFCDIFRASYGAKLADEFLDMTKLSALADTFETRNDWFDWIFDGSLGVWEASKLPLRVGRAVPIPQGSLVTAVRDVRQTLPSGVFNQFNIVKGSLTKKLSMFEFQPFDGLIVEYTDLNTWKTQEVKCILPGRAGTNLDRLKLPGCTSRNRAYREGMYIQSRREMQRKTVVFQTGLEGNIPAFMDLISITHDTLRVGQGGMIVAYNPATKVMTLSEQVKFATSAVVHKIAIRGDDGAILGVPITCTPGATANKVILASNPIETLDFSTDRVPPLYAFGVSDVYAFMGKVSGIRPLDASTVEITAVNYVGNVYDYEDAATIDAVEVPVIRNVTNPKVGWVTITPVPNKSDRGFIDWLPAPAAASYILQSSYDGGTTWTPIGNFKSPPVEIGLNQGSLKVRVAPFALNGNVIYTESATYVVGSNIAPPPSPTLATSQPAFVGLTASVLWGAVSGADGYSVDVYIASVLKRTIAAGTALRADYTKTDYSADGGTGRAIEFRVKAYNAGGDGTASTLVQTNPANAAATTLAVGSPTGSNYPVSWAYTPVGDEAPFNLYASTTMGFTPGVGNLVTTAVINSATLAAPVRPLYWRVGSVDQWGAEITLSAEAVIP